MGRLLPQKRPASMLAIGVMGTADQGTGEGAGRAGRGRRREDGATIDAFFKSKHCAVCDGLTRESEPLCTRCRRDPPSAALSLTARVLRVEGDLERCVRVCGECSAGATGCGGGRGIACVNDACPVYFELGKLGQELEVSRRLLGAGMRCLGPEF